MHGCPAGGESAAAGRALFASSARLASERFAVASAARPAGRLPSRSPPKKQVGNGGATRTGEPPPKPNKQRTYDRWEKVDRLRLDSPRPVATFTPRLREDHMKWSASSRLLDVAIACRWSCFFAVLAPLTCRGGQGKFRAARAWFPTADRIAREPVGWHPVGTTRAGGMEASQLRPQPRPSPEIPAPTAREPAARELYCSILVTVDTFACPEDRR